MNYDISFIGAGNMGMALIAAAHKTGKSIAVCDHHEEKRQFAKETYGAAPCSTEEAAFNGKMVFLGIKPYAIEALCREISPLINKETVIVSMAAGKSLRQVTEAAGTDKVIRIMPNTPVCVGTGVIQYCTASGITPEDEENFRDAMKYAGFLDKIEEKHMDAAAALSGSGPAFVYIFAEALADGAVKCGLPREKARRYAAETLKGAAEMLLSSGKHAGLLKDEVCSPGGTTIEGVLTLEKGGFRAAASEAVVSTFEKTEKLK